MLTGDIRSQIDQMKIDQIGNASWSGDISDPREVIEQITRRTRCRARLPGPGVTIEFLHTGWSGNWSAHVEQFERETAIADGVVLLQLMRTMFGRSIRARCHLPWRGCRGRGQGEIVNTIKRVVPAARARVRAFTPSTVGSS